MFKELDRKFNNLVFTIYLSGVITALAGILTGIGLINLKSAFEGGRIASTLQYPNSFAVFMIVVLVMGSYIFYREKDQRLKYIVLIGNSLSFISFIGATSRGAWLIYPFVVLAYLVLTTDRKNKLPFETTYWLMGFAGYYLLFRLNLFDVPMLDLLVLTVVCIASIFVNRVSELIFAKVSQKIIIIASCIIGASGILLGIISGILGQLVVKAAGAFNSISASERLLFYLDGFKMALHKPIIGFGGGGWRAAYQSYQGHLYHTTEVHNHWLQVLIETGIIGFAAYSSIWVLFLISVYKVYTKSEKHKDVAVFTGLAAIALGLHTFLDFDFSLSSIYLIFFLLLAIIRTITIAEFRGSSKLIKGGWLNFILLPAVIIMLFSFGSQKIALSNYKEGFVQQEKGQLVEAESNYRTAVSYNPFSAEYKLALSRMYFANGIQYNKAETVSEAVRLINEAKNQDKMSSPLRMYLSEQFFAISKVKEAMDEAKASRDLNPMNIHRYSNLMKAYVTAAINYVEEGNVELAKEYAAKTIGVEKELNTAWSNISQERKGIWVHGPELVRNPDISLHLAQASALLGSYDDSLKYLQEARKEDKYKSFVQSWEAAVILLQGDKQKADELRSIITNEQQGQMDGVVKIIEKMKNK